MNAEAESQGSLRCLVNVLKLLEPLYCFDSINLSESESNLENDIKKMFELSDASGIRLTTEVSLKGAWKIPAAWPVGCDRIGAIALLRQPDRIRVLRVGRLGYLSTLAQ